MLFFPHQAELLILLANRYNGSPKSSNQKTYDNIWGDEKRYVALNGARSHQPFTP